MTLQLHLCISLYRIDIPMPLQNTRDTLLRHWELLKLLPHGGTGRSSKDLCDQLNELGYKIQKRQINRDLNMLSRTFPIECNYAGAGETSGWRWAKGASIDVPGLSLADALSIEMVRGTIEPILPSSILNALRPSFLQARKTLTAIKKNNPKATWADKVRAIPSTLQFLPPMVDSAVQECIHNALIESIQIEVQYQPLNKETATILILHPHALINRDSVQYLVATAFEYTDPRLYALHRIHSAESTNDKAILTPSFDLDSYLKQSQGGFMTNSGEAVYLRATIEPWLAKILSETPLSEDQSIRNKGRQHLLRATIPDTWQLRWWILSVGNGIAITGPKRLQREIKSELETALAKYR